MKRRLALFLSVAVTLLFAGVVWAQEDAHGRDVEEILQQITQSQNVEQVGAIDPDEVDMELLEELGDGVMGLMIADEEQHEWMDRMMGPRNGSRAGQRGSESAFAILQARYARGDLSQEEFRRMKKELL